MLFLAVLLMAALLPGPLLASTPRLTALNAQANGPLSTLSLTLSEPVTYHVFALANPDRIVIDLPEMQLTSRDLPRDTGLIGTVRTGRPSAGSSRLVIECTEPVTVAATQLRPTQQGRSHMLTVSLRSAKSHSDSGLAAVVPPATTGRYAATGWTAPPPPRRPPGDVRSDSLLPVRKVVALDPGHGGHDPGAMTPSGLMEKSITLATARELRRELEAIGGYRVILTRNRDTFIALRDRIAIARQAGADVMVSIHANKLDNPSIRGLSVYTLSENASDAEAAALAESENKADVISHLDLRGATPEVTNILIDLAQRETMNSSSRLASLVVDRVGRDGPLLVRPHRFAGFAVLKAPDVPSILVELGFISNKEDATSLASANGRRKLVRALARGIDAYFARVEMANSR